MVDSDSDSSSSSADPASPALRRLSKTITRLERSLDPLLPLKSLFVLDRKRNPVQHAKSNSTTLAVNLEDIRPLAVSHTRKNSCDCEACGGERLAKKLQFALLPKSEIPSNAAKVTAIRKLGSMLRCSFRISTCSRLPGMGLKYSTVSCSEPATLYTKPPSTPALTRYLQRLTATTQPSSPSLYSPLPPIRERFHAVRKSPGVPKLILPARTCMATPSTSVSDGFGSLSRRSVPSKQLSRGEGEMHSARGRMTEAGRGYGRKTGRLRRLH